MENKSLNNYAEHSSREQRIFSALAAAPEGTVVTYGQLAELAGLARAARLVGRTLSNLPRDTQLPWHRVINAAGKLSLDPDTDSGKYQRARLQEEGVVVSNGRISLAQFRWRP